MDSGPLSDAERFDRQVRFAPLGRAGQERLQAARALVVGVGALGGAIAQALTRAGVGELVLVDRDVVEPTNLARQVLFDAEHARAGTPKSLAALETLARIGGPTRIEPQVAHVDATNLARLAQGANLLLDGTDNFATRYLLNDFAVSRGIPWIYAGVVGASGLVLPVLSGKGACLRCIFPDPPPPGVLATCESAGVIAPAVLAIGAFVSGFALHILGGDPADPLEPALIEIDAWNGSVRRLVAPRSPDCPACNRGEFPFLAAANARAPVVLCGRNSVQLPAPSMRPDLALLARRLQDVAREVQNTGVFLRFKVGAERVTVFGDGRALVEGTSDPARARAVYDRFVGA
jgi:adenylyltransferase/sulfurtransferase